MFLQQLEEVIKHEEKKRSIKGKPNEKQIEFL